jgi:hypothetical protein
MSEPDPTIVFTVPAARPAATMAAISGGDTLRSLPDAAVSVTP